MSATASVSSLKWVNFETTRSTCFALVWNFDLELALKQGDIKKGRQCASSKSAGF